MLHHVPSIKMFPCHSQKPWQKSSGESGELGQSPVAQKNLSGLTRESSLTFPKCFIISTEALGFGEQEAFSW